MASHSRPIANILCKGIKKSAPKKEIVKKGNTNKSK